MKFATLLSYYNGLINEFIWNKTGLYLLLFVGLLTGFALKFFQIFRFRLWWKATFSSLFKKDVFSAKGDKSISPFQSTCTVLAATIGVGNIVGVTSALSIGGPGAIFWMWIAAILGMTTGYSENVLGTYFRRKNFNGEWCGGAMYYLRDGLGAKKGFKKIGKLLAGMFSIFTLFASFGIGSMGQVNKIVINLESAFPWRSLQSIVLYDSVTLYTLIIGIVIFLLISMIVLGGIKRIALFAEKIVPFMIIFFMTGSLVVIAKNYHNIIPALSAIFTSAFTADAGVGGFIGTVVSCGFKRGVFSNEAGLGSSVMIHASSSANEPCVQGMWNIFEIFVDTIVMCSVTALVVLTSGVYNINGTNMSVNDSTMMASAFNTVFSWGNMGEKFIAISIFLFAFTSVLGWNHYGTKAWEYLFGTRCINIYKALHLASIIVGALLTSSLAWDISDTFNGLMMLPNLIGVILLLPLVVRITKNYIDRNIHGKNLLPMLSVFSDIQKSSIKKGR